MWRLGLKMIDRLDKDSTIKSKKKTAFWGAYPRYFCPKSKFACHVVQQQDDTTFFKWSLAETFARRPKLCLITKV